MSGTEVSIPMPDGAARAFVFTPKSGDGPWPTAILYMDALAIRPAMFEIAERVASHGYYVLLPDMFWRKAPYPPFDVKEMLANRPLLAEFMGTQNPERTVSDTGAFLAWLDKQPEAKADKVGVAGYCMGGAMTLRAAAAFPDRVVAAAAFHGGNLATDQPASPHLLAPQIKAKVLIAGADKDSGFSPEQAEVLAKAFVDAGVDAEVVIWEGKLHGYAPRDMPVYDEEASERHYREMVALFDSQLK